MLDIILTGNPNVGKTTLFNSMTKSFEHVGNWQGVTVEKKVKNIQLDGHKARVVDLPGLYSMTVYSPDEAVSRNVLLEFKGKGVIINVCDAANLKRNLYLTLQLLELGLPVVLAVNMMDEVVRQGKAFDGDKIAQNLNIPIVPVSARNKTSVKKLMQTAVESSNKKREKPNLFYLENLPIDQIKNIIQANAIKSGLCPNYAAIKILENDNYIIDRLDLSKNQLQQIEQYIGLQSKVAEHRYAFIDKICSGAFYYKNKSKQYNQVAPQLNVIDKILLNKYLAFPIFLVIMLLIFTVTFFLLGKWLSDGLNYLIANFVHNPVVSFLRSKNISDWIVSLVGNGIINGVGAVLVFLPQITLLILFLSLLQDSGYISRVAFMTDGLFSKIGLSGRAVFTLLMGFGCSAAAILTTKGLEDDNMRKKTVLVTPFMSCSARLPIYLLLVSKFFSGNPLIIFALYLLGGGVAVLFAAILQKIKRLKSGRLTFIMEIPPYRLPTPTRVFQLVWHNLKTFLTKVGTVILSMSIIVWVLSGFSLKYGFVGADSVLADTSIMASFARVLSPIFTPLGFGSWQAVTTLLSGLASKEIIIATIESLGGVSLLFTGQHQALCALSFMVFVLLYVPCFATLAAINKEIGLRYTLFSLVLQTGAAYIFSLLFYTFGMLFIKHTTLAVSVLIAFVLLIILAIVLKKTTKHKRLKDFSPNLKFE